MIYNCFHFFFFWLSVVTRTEWFATNRANIWKKIHILKSILFFSAPTVPRTQGTIAFFGISRFHWIDTCKSIHMRIQFCMSSYERLKVELYAICVRNSLDFIHWNSTDFRTVTQLAFNGMKMIAVIPFHFHSHKHIHTKIQFIKQRSSCTITLKNIFNLAYHF